MLLTLPTLPACEALGGGATIQLDSAEVSLPSGAEVHDVAVGGAGATDTIAPGLTEARPGDAIRFTVGDHRTHALAFVTDSLPASARAFLEESLQLRGPPLVNEGAAWVVSLEAAPPGRYPFVCMSHGAGGVLVVEPGA